MLYYDCAASISKYNYDYSHTKCSLTQVGTNKIKCLKTENLRNLKVI